MVATADDTIVRVIWTAITVAVAVACLAGCSSSSADTHDDLGYPRETVTCGAVDAGGDLRWHDQDLLDTRAHDLGLQTSGRYTASLIVTGSGTSPTTPADFQKAYRSPAVSVTAEKSPLLRRVCTSGPGRPTRAMHLVDDVVGYGPQRLTAAQGRTGSTVARTVERFIARRYAADDVTCDPPDRRHFTAATPTMPCMSRERMFYVRLYPAKRMYLVIPGFLRR